MRQYSSLTILCYVIGPILIIVSHFGSLLVLKTGLSWGAIAWLLLLYIVRMLGTTGIYHRLLTHKSYQTPSWFLRLGCIVTASAGQMGPSWWKAHHMFHHLHADQALDPHSPLAAHGLRGFVWSQGGWLLSPQFFPERLPKDTESDRVLQLIDRLHFVPVLALGGISYLLGGVEYLGAFFLSTTLLFHGVQTVNSLSHLFGAQPFATGDQSRNSALVAFLTLGEGWHNLHHAFQSSSRHGITVKAGQVAYLPDPTFRFIKLLELLKVATKVRIPSEGDLLKNARRDRSVNVEIVPIKEFSVNP